MKKFDKAYVGVLSTDKRGFLTPDGDDAAAAKRKANVDRWIGKHGGIRVIDNNPASGFKFVGMNSRYSTSNKFLQVEDPRGFILEVSIENALKIISETKIDNGVIDAELVWVRNHGGSNQLVRSDSTEYKDAIPFDVKKQKLTAIKMKDVKVGDILVDNRKAEWVYLGKCKPKFHVKVSHNSQVMFGNFVNSGVHMVIDEEIINSAKDIFVRIDFNTNPWRDIATSLTAVKIKGKVEDTTKYADYFVANAKIPFDYAGEAVTVKNKAISACRADGFRNTSSSIDLIEAKLYTPRGK